MSKNETRTIFNFLNQASTKFFIMIILGCCIFIIPDALPALTGSKISEYKDSFLTISGAFIFIAGIVGLIDNRITNRRKLLKKNTQKITSTGDTEGGTDFP